MCWALQSSRIRPTAILKERCAASDGGWTAPWCWPEASIANDPSLCHSKFGPRGGGLEASVWPPPSTFWRSSSSRSSCYDGAPRAILRARARAGRWVARGSIGLRAAQRAARWRHAWANRATWRRRRGWAESQRSGGQLSRSPRRSTPAVDSAMFTLPRGNPPSTLDGNTRPSALGMRPHGTPRGVDIVLREWVGRASTPVSRHLARRGWQSHYATASLCTAAARSAVLRAPPC